MVMAALLQNPISSNQCHKIYTQILRVADTQVPLKIF